MFHPAVTAGDRAKMSTVELAFFTDDPVCQVVAFRDYQRARQIERANAEAFHAAQVRDHSLAAFFRDSL